MEHRNFAGGNPSDTNFSQVMSLETAARTHNPGQSAHGRVIACLGNYVPRQCGIATFTQDLCQAITSAGATCRIAAINDYTDGYAYPREVCWEVHQHDLADYQGLAELLNASDCEVLLVQHEFGIYGGRAGSFLNALLDEVRMPVVSTMHTVLSRPAPEYHARTVQLAERSDRLVVMAQRAVDILVETYGIDPEQISVIPHGVPDLPFSDPVSFKKRLGVAGKTVLMTFGLISPGKGIEHMIEAMPAIVKRHPDVVYLVVGATHPTVRRRHGEAYRNQLEEQARQLGVGEHVRLLDRYVPLDELCEYLQACDVYVTPYLNEEQIVSGTLAYALSAGCAVVSTPYWHAAEVLADGRGRLVSFRDPAAFAREVNSLLDNPELRQAMRCRAFDFSRSAVWRKVGESYVRLFDNLLEPVREVAIPRGAEAIVSGSGGKTTIASLSSPMRDGGAEGSGSRSEGEPLLPPLRLDHLYAITDDVGILQHATYTIPNRDHGYCVDDCARALIFAATADEFVRDEGLGRVARRYLGFVHHAWNTRLNRFRNFMSYDRTWLEEAGSEDSHGRAVWALGRTAVHAREEGIRRLATVLFGKALPPVVGFQSPRAWAYAILGGDPYLQRFSGDRNAHEVFSELAVRLLEQTRANGDRYWPWCEDRLTYDNARLCHALLVAGKRMGHDEMIECGLVSLDWLYQLKTRNGGFDMVGNRGWATRDGQWAAFDQQPTNAHAMVDACAAAFRLTGNGAWRNRAAVSFEWFLGRNTHSVRLYCDETGGCRDGLTPWGRNENQGAESTLACLLSWLTMRSLGSAVESRDQPRDRRASSRTTYLAAVPAPIVDGAL